MPPNAILIVFSIISALAFLAILCPFSLALLSPHAISALYKAVPALPYLSFFATLPIVVVFHSAISIIFISFISLFFIITLSFFSHIIDDISPTLSVFIQPISSIAPIDPSEFYHVTIVLFFFFRLFAVPHTIVVGLGFSRIFPSPIFLSIFAGSIVVLFISIGVSSQFLIAIVFIFPTVLFFYSILSKIAATIHVFFPTLILQPIAIFILKLFSFSSQFTATFAHLASFSPTIVSTELFSIELLLQKVL